MTVVLFKAPKVIKDYTPDDGDAFKKSIDALLDGSISLNIKSLLLREFEANIDDSFVDIKKQYKEAISSYELLSQIVQGITQSEALFSTMEANYSPVLEANYRFAIGSLVQVLNSFYIALKLAGEPSDVEISEDLVTKIKETISDYIEVSNSEMPDSTSHIQDGDKDASIIVTAIVSINFALLSSLIVIVAMLVGINYSLSENQIEEFELLLRDWPQEFIAQVSLIRQISIIERSSFSLGGIIPDDDDFLE